MKNFVVMNINPDDATETSVYHMKAKSMDHAFIKSIVQRFEEELNSFEEEDLEDLEEAMYMLAEITDDYPMLIAESKEFTEDGEFLEFTHFDGSDIGRLAKEIYNESQL